MPLRAIKPGEFQDMFLVPAIRLAVVVEIKEMVDGGLTEKIVVARDYLSGDLGCFAKIGLRFVVLRLEDQRLAERGKAAVAVAATGGLGDRVEAREGAKHEGEVNIDPSLDQLRRNESNGLSVFQTLADSIEMSGAMSRTHQGRKVEA